MQFASLKPSDFVRQLTVDGLQVPNAGVVPLTKYVSAAPAFKRDNNPEDILVPLQQLRDKQNRRVVDLTRNYGRLIAGQGYPDDFRIVMGFIADNLDAVKKLTVHDWKKTVTKDADGKNKVKFDAISTSTAGQRYFTGDGKPRTVLNNMVAGGVFGVDCIGFISQFLVAAGVWNEYKTYYPADYLRDFKPVERLRDVSRLSLLIWENYHIAIVDRVHQYIPDFARVQQLRVDVCQSSGSAAYSGPQLNKAVLLQATPNRWHGFPLFKILSPGEAGMPMPVRGDCVIARMPDLSWVGDWLGTEEA